MVKHIFKHKASST